MPAVNTVLARRYTASERAWLAWDVGIMALVAVNLALIAFDSLFVADAFAGLVGAVSPGFRDWYAATVHAHFAVIDLYFVAVFVADVLLGWTLAVIQQRYHRWFFYPFVHWYDVLGCIPLAGLRWLRVLRVFSLGIRLQRMGLIDVRRWRAFAFAQKYYDILVEEISDRVVTNVLDGVEQELQSDGSEFTGKILREVVQPRRDALVASLSTRVEATVLSAYAANREQIQAYATNLVDRAITSNAALAGLERVPMLGAAVARSIDWAIRDTVHNVLDEAVAGLDTPEFDALIQNIAGNVFDQLADERAAADPELRRALVQVLELLKDQVQVQQWKRRYD